MMVDLSNYQFNGGGGDDKEWIAGVYSRVSTEAEVQLQSAEHQVQYFEKWCKDNNMRIYDFYVDAGISGTQIRKRLAFQRMIRDAFEGKINCIVAKSITRFARNQVDAIKTINEGNAKGIRFIFLEQGIDTIKPDGMKTVGLWAWVAEEEARTNSARRKFGGYQAQKNGHFTTCRPPFGYKSVNKKLVIDEEEAIIVRRIYKLYLEGKGCQIIATTLNKEGVKTRKGEAWARTKIQYILQNHAYKGWIVGNKEVTTDPITKKRRALPPEKWVVTENAHEPIISPEEWDRVQEIMKDKSFTMGKKSVNLFTGLLRCKMCGHNLLCRTYYKDKKGKHDRANGKVSRYYVCMTKTNKSYSLCSCKPVSELVLKEVVHAELTYLKENADMLKRMKDKAVAKIKAALKDAQVDTENIQKQIDKVQELRSALVMKNLNGIVPDDLYKQQNSIFEKQILELSRKKEQIQSTQSAEKKFESIFNEFIQALEQYEDMDSVTNLTLRHLIDVIWVTEDRSLEITMKYEVADSLFIGDDPAIVGVEYAQPVTTVMAYTPPEEGTKKLVVAESLSADIKVETRISPTIKQIHEVGIRWFVGLKENLLPQFAIVTDVKSLDWRGGLGLS